MPNSTTIKVLQFIAGLATKRKNLRIAKIWDGRYWIAWDCPIDSGQARVSQVAKGRLVEVDVLCSRSPIACFFGLPGSDLLEITVSLPPNAVWGNIKQRLDQAIINGARSMKEPKFMN